MFTRKHVPHFIPGCGLILYRKWLMFYEDCFKIFSIMLTLSLLLSETHYAGIIGLGLGLHCCGVDLCRLCYSFIYILWKVICLIEMWIATCEMWLGILLSTCCLSMASWCITDNDNCELSIIVVNIIWICLVTSME